MDDIDLTGRNLMLGSKELCISLLKSQVLAEVTQVDEMISILKELFASAEDRDSYGEWDLGADQMIGLAQGVQVGFDSL